MINKLKEFEKILGEALGKVDDWYIFDKFQQLFKLELAAKQTMKQAMADATVIECCPDSFDFKNGVMKDSETEVKKDGIITGCRGVSCADCWDRVAG